MILSVLWTILVYAICLWFISKSPFYQKSELTTYELWFLFSLKVLAGISLFTIYTYYYTDRSSADIYKYFDDAQILFQLAKDDFGLYLKILLNIPDSSELLYHVREQMNYWDKPYNHGVLNDNRIMIRTHSLMNFISGGNFQVHNVLFNLISFTGLIGLYTFFRGIFSLKKWIFICALFLVPSMLFWGSGALKESILFFAMGMFLYHLFVNKSRGKLIWAFLALVLMFWMKSYVLMALISGLIFILSNRLLPYKPIPNFMIVNFILLICFLGLELSGVSEFSKDLIQKQKDFFLLVEQVSPNSLYELPVINSIMDIAINSPRAVFTSLFRPFPWEVNGALDGISAIENLSFIILIFVAVFYRKRNLKISEWSLFNWSFVICLAIIIGLVTPVFGALVRYKIPFLPFFLVAIFSIIDLERLYKSIPVLKKLKNL